MIVTHTPASARKQAYTFADKLEAMRQELLAIRAKVIRPRTGGTRRLFASAILDFANKYIWRRNCTNWNLRNPLTVYR